MSRGSKWLWRQVDVGALDSAGAVRRFALSVGFRAVILTSLAGLVLLPLLYVLKVVATPIDQTMRLMVAFSWLFGGALSAACAFVAGHVVRELLLSRRRFERLSRTDTLSGLANRRAFNEASLATDRDASLAIIDIDRFKTINDRYGHQTGDRVIQSLSSLLREVFGEAHLVARLGGEEFGVIVKGGSVAERLALVEQARRRVAAETILFQEAELRVTVSTGVAEFSPEKRPESVYAWADKALYLAKESGRDCVFHENSLDLVEAFPSDHAPDDAQLFAAIGRRG